MSFVGGILTLHAETPLHPGSGTSVGVVDLPVQRERHTQFPTIPGTALKGVLREQARRQVGGDKKNADKDDTLVALFGGPAGNANPEAGCLSIADARLLAFPVRSLKGVFGWVTCPLVLARLARDARLAGGSFASLLKPERFEALVRPEGDKRFAVVAANVSTPDHPMNADGCVILEEYDFLLKGSPDFDQLAAELADNFLPTDSAFSATRERFKRQLVLLHDDDFTHFARHGTEVVARIGLDYDTKTVKNGALFYQELVPAESVFYSIVLAEAPRSRETKLDARGALKAAEERIPPFLQIGADEGTGRGLCATRFSGVRQ